MQTSRGVFFTLSLIAGLVLLAVLAPCASATAPEPLRVMSFNIRYATAADGENAWDERREMVVETIRAFDPDLLGVQECLAGQADYLQAALPGYRFTGVGRDDGDRGGEMCAVFARAARFEKLAAGHFWLSATPEIVGSHGWDGACTRMVTWLQLRFRQAAQSSAADDTLWIFNTHFDHVGVRAREESAALLRERIAEVCGDQPVIVTGDFNAPADLDREGPYRLLLGEPRGADHAPRGVQLVDSYRQLHAPATGEGTFHGFGGQAGVARIDWILASTQLRPISAEIIRTAEDGHYPSDHFPVSTVLAWPSGSHAQP
jgi:endonuclease/exonuclease/phosphatase family metal-dependent hydrolase